MHHAVREYRKIDIARSMIDTAIAIYIDGGDRFSVIHLASAAEEVIARLLIQRQTEAPSGPKNQIARDKAIAATLEIMKTWKVQSDEKKVSTFLNHVRNQTKHHGKNDPDTVVADVEGLALDVIRRAIDNYGRYEARLSERMISFANTAIVTLPVCAPYIAVIPEKTEGTMLHDEAAASALVDQLVTYAEVSVTPTQHNAAVEILRSLPDDDSSVARFVDHCASDDSLTELADALRKRLDGPWKLL